MQQFPTIGFGPGGSISQVLLLGFLPSGVAPPATFGEWHDPFLSVLRVI